MNNETSDQRKDGTGLSPVVEVIDERTTFTVHELCRSCGVGEETIERLEAEGIIEAAGAGGRERRFTATSLKRTRITVRLQRDLGVNLAGAALAVELLERIERLQARLDALRLSG